MRGRAGYNSGMTADEMYEKEVSLLPLPQRLRLAALLLEGFGTPADALPPAAPERPRPRPRRGSGKGDISYLAPDFDAPLADMREYSQ